MAIAWTGAAATALLFVRLGVVLDGAPLDPGSIALLVGLALVAAVSAAAGPLWSDRAGSETERRLRGTLVGRIFAGGVVAASGRSGALLSVATDAVERTAHYRAGFLGPIAGSSTAPLVVLAVMALTTDAAIAGWLALFLLLVPVLIGGFQRVVRPIGAENRRSQARLTAEFLEAIQALDTLVFARAAGRIGTALARRGEEHRRRLMRLLAGNQLLILVVDAAFSLTVVVVAAALTVGRVADGSLSLGGGVAILLMTTLVIGPVDVVGQFFYVGVAGRAAQQRIGDQLGASAGAAEPAPAAGTPAAAGAPATAGAPAPAGRDAGAAERSALVLDDVTAGWPGRPPVLHGLSLRVEPGERVALVGPSGVGKSTVAALLQAHLTPSSGRVLVDGLDASAGPPAAIRERLAVVEQRTFLFLGTIADNLRLADPDADDERLWDALDRAGLRADVEAMPAGLDTPVGEHGRLLSGGQAQRLAIARAWLRNAPILLLDEPTSQVDLVGEAAILAALDRLAADRTVLMIAHRPGAILAADRVIDLASPGARA